VFSANIWFFELVRLCSFVGGGPVVVVVVGAMGVQITEEGARLSANDVFGLPLEEDDMVPFCLLWNYLKKSGLLSVDAKE